MRIAAAALAALALAACGGADEAPLTIFAAASLTAVFEQLDREARFNFAGSDELATQLREGADADLYAAANDRYPSELHAEGIVEKPLRFATNRLVLVTPAGNPARIRSVDDLLRPDVRLVIAAEGVPVGDYARRSLRDSGLRAALDNVVSHEQDVKGVLGKVRLGEADAGIVYATDAAAARDDVQTFELGSTRPVSYSLAIVRGSDRRREAEEFVRRLLGARGQRLLREAGFAAPLTGPAGS